MARDDDQSRFCEIVRITSMQRIFISKEARLIRSYGSFSRMWSDSRIPFEGRRADKLFKGLSFPSSKARTFPRCRFCGPCSSFHFLVCRLSRISIYRGTISLGGHQKDPLFIFSSHLHFYL